MPAARHWTVRLVVTLEEPAPALATVDIRLACWLDRVARLIAHRDTPRGPPAAAAVAAGASAAPDR